MKILLNNFDLIEATKSVHKLGYVPTMGSIHKGHESLIKISKNNSNKTLVSIYVNPKQFNNNKDLINYPRNIQKDLRILKKLNVDFVYIPKDSDIYNKDVKKKISISKKDKVLCAKFRKGHFEGVLEVMDRLTYLIKPDKIYMGEKDYQQFFLVKKYIEKKYKTKIIPCKTIRSKYKIALSSRNLLLNKKQLEIGNQVASNLINFKRTLRNKINLKKFLEIKKLELNKFFGIDIEYLEIRNEKNLKKSNMIKNSRIFIAYYIGKIRLIDNL